MKIHHRCRWLLLLCGPGILGLLPGLCSASQLVVHPGQSIAVALSEADTVLVTPGTYAEEALVLPENGLLMAQDPSSPPVLVAADGRRSLLICRDIAGAKVQGIHFASSDVPEFAMPQEGGAVLMKNAAVVFEDCRFQGLKAFYGGAVFAGEGAQATFLLCSFEDNESLTSGGAIAAAQAGLLDFQDCLFINNRAPLGGSVLNLALQSRANLDQCTLAGNGMEGSSDLAAWNSGEFTVQNTAISGSIGAVFLGDVASPVESGSNGNAGSDPIEDPDPAQEGKPLATRLAANHPNPFNPSTTISLDIGRAGAVRVDIYDVAGRRVRGLFSGSLEAGSHALVWDGRGQDGRMAAAGVYFARLKTESVIDTRRMLLVK